MHQREEDVTFKGLFIPFTTKKAVILIIIVGLVVYFNALFNGFVWDDLSNIIYNPQVHAITLENIVGKSNINLALQYRPVVALYFSLLYAFFKENAFFYHLLNIVFHITNSIIVFFLFKKFLSQSISLILSLVFLVHPMQVESAVWIANSGNLYFLFGSAALLLSMKENRNIKQTIALVGLLFLSLLSKETGILFFAMIFTYMFFHNKKQMLIFSAVSILLFLLYSVLRFGIGKDYLSAHSSIIPIAKMSLEQRLLHIPEIIFYYLKTFIIPMKLVIMQFWTVTKINYQSFYIPLFYDCLFALLLVCTTVYFYTKRKVLFPSFIFFLTWFVLGISLTLQIFPLDMTVSDRWFYFPMVGLLGVVGMVVQEVVLKKRLHKYTTYLLWASGIIILLAFSVRTSIRNLDWQSDMSLYMHDRMILDNFIIENNIGWNYQHIQDWKNANAYYINSVRLYPYWAVSLNNLAYTYEILSDREKAKTTFYRVLQASDYHPEEYHRDLTFSAWVLQQKESPEVVKDFVKKALKKNPTNGALWAYLAISTYRLGNQKEALDAAEKAKIFSSSKAMNSLYDIIMKKQPMPKDIALLE